MKDPIETFLDRFCPRRHVHRREFMRMGLEWLIHIKNPVPILYHFACDPRTKDPYHGEA